MAESDAAVIDTPPGKTNVGDRFRAAMEAGGKEPVAAKPDKPEQPPAEKKPDALGVALGEKVEKKEPEKAGANGEWEKEEVLKEFDPQKANWGKARQVMGTQALEKRQLQKEIQEAKDALKTAKEAGANPAELETLRGELNGMKETLAEREQRIKAINAEYSDEYRALAAEKATAETKAISRFKSYGGDADELAEALRLPEGKVKSAQIKQLLTDFEPEDKTRIIAAIEKIGETDDKIAEFRKDLPSRWDEISKKREEHLLEDQAKTMKALESNFEKIASKLPETSPLLREIDGEIDGADKWNHSVKTAYQNGLRIMRGDGATFEESVAIAVKGSDYDRVAGMLIETRKGWDADRKRLEEFDRGGADFKGGKRPPAGDEKLTGGEKYRRALSAAQSGGG